MLILLHARAEGCCLLFSCVCDHVVCGVWVRVVLVLGSVCVWSSFCMYEVRVRAMRAGCVVCIQICKLIRIYKFMLFH